MTATLPEFHPSDPVRSVMEQVVATMPVWHPLQDVVRELTASDPHRGVTGRFADS